MKTYVHLWYYHAEFYLEWEIFRTKVIDKIRIHLYSKLWCLWDNVERYSRARQATDDNMIRCVRLVCCMIGYRHTHTHTHTHTPRMFNTFCFSMATVGTQTRLYVTFISKFYSCHWSEAPNHNVDDLNVFLVFSFMFLGYHDSRLWNCVVLASVVWCGLKCGRHENNWRQLHRYMLYLLFSVNHASRSWFV